MTPKEKARNLAMKYWKLNYDWDGGTKDEWAKEGALIALDEIINAYPHTFGLNKEYTKDGELVTSIVNIRPNIIYWQEVKQEINNL
jgi:hypothetical protein